MSPDILVALMGIALVVWICFHRRIAVVPFWAGLFVIISAAFILGGDDGRGIIGLAFWMGLFLGARVLWRRFKANKSAK